MKNTLFFTKYIVQAVAIVLAFAMTMSPIVAVAQVVTERTDIETNETVQGEIAEITDEEVALAPTLPAQERTEMSWWWLLIIAACGTTSYIWYRNHRKPMESGDLDIY